MAANIPDLGAVAQLGSQFHHNVFDTVQKKAIAQGKKTAHARAQQAKATEQSREAYANSAAQAVKQGRSAYAKGQQQKQKQAAQAAKAHAQGVKSGRVAPAPGAPPRTFAMGSTPQQKAAAKTAASAVKTMQQQRNAAHGEALKFQAAQFKIKQQQVNYAHGQAIQENKAREKAANPPARKAAAAVKPTTAPSRTNTSTGPAFSNAPERHEPVKAVAIPQTSFSSQFTPQKATASPQGSATATFSSGSTPSAPKPVSAPPAPVQRTPASTTQTHVSGTTPNKSLRGNPVPSVHTEMQRRMGKPGMQLDVGPATPTVSNQQFRSPHAEAQSRRNVGGGSFPQHEHPQGSSTAPLPKLTAAQPKPNTFTVGSRNAKPGGLAARGSQLEAWAIGRQAEVRKQRGSDNTQLRLGD